MRTLVSVFFLTALAACQGEGTLTVVAGDSGSQGSTGTGTGAATGTGTGVATGGGGCGAVNHWAATLNGRVARPDGSDAAGADVRVEERNWFPMGQIMGSAVARPDGTYTIAIADLIDVEDCWGTALDYVVVAEDGALSAERNVNTPLFNAIQDQTLAADIADLQLAP